MLWGHSNLESQLNVQDSFGESNYEYLILHTVFGQRLESQTKALGPGALVIGTIA
jgi:hypothetical protein